MKTTQTVQPQTLKIKRAMIFFDPRRYDTEKIAKNFDWIDMGVDVASSIPELKKYNPNLEAYVYINAASIADWRSTSYRDYELIKPGFAWTLDNHPEWFYPWDYFAVPSKIADAREGYKKYFNDGVTPLNFFFFPDYQYLYLVNPSYKSYQDMWLSLAIDTMKQNKFDGIFVDTLGPSGGWETSNSSLIISPDQIQSFQQAVFPKLREVGIEFAHNSCSSHYNTFPGKYLLNPHWSAQDPELPSYLNTLTPRLAFPHAIHMVDNTPNTTAKMFFQEWAFFSAGDDQVHYYNLQHWLRSIEDMQLVGGWNETLPPDQKRKIIQFVIGVDLPTNPSQGENGWIQFALASYLLGVHENTYLGMVKRPLPGDPPNELYVPMIWDYSSAEKLGPAQAQLMEHTGVYPDRSLQSRSFVNGLVIVNGHPTEKRTFKLPIPVKDIKGTSLQGNIELPAHTGRIFYSTDM